MFALPKPITKRAAYIAVDDFVCCVFSVLHRLNDLCGSERCRFVQVVWYTQIEGIIELLL